MDPLTSCQRKDLVDNLITNCPTWNEENREQLSSLPDAALLEMNKPLAENTSDDDEAKKKEKEMENEGKAKDGKLLEGMSDEELENEIKKRREGKATADNASSMSTEDWIKFAPPEIRETFKHAHEIEQQKKLGLISKLTANLEGEEKRNQEIRLQNRSIEDLTQDLTLIPKQQEPVKNQQEGKPEENWLTNILGKVGPGNNPDVKDDNDALMLPTMNYDEEETDPLDTQGITTKIPTVANMEQQWINSAPESVRSLVQNAVAVEASQKEEIINRLTSHISNTSERMRVQDRLKERSLAELKDLEVLNPTPPNRKTDFTGSSTPVDNSVKLSQHDRDDILIPPSIDFSQKV